MVGVNGTTPRVSLSDGAGNGMGAGGTFVDTEVDGGFRLSELPPLADDGAGGGGARRGAGRGAGRGARRGARRGAGRGADDGADKGGLSGEEVDCELDMFVVMVTVVKLGSSRVSPKSKRSKI